MSAITIGNDLVHYEVLGRGKPVVLVHTWLGSWRYWIPTMQQLGMKYRTYAIDLWGFGDSGKNRNHYHLEGQVALLRAFVEKMGIPKAVFVGHGLGAAVVTHYAIDPTYRNRVHRLMAITPPLFNIAPPPSTARSLPSGTQRADAPTVVRPEGADIDREKLRQAALAAGLEGITGQSQRNDQEKKPSQKSASPPDKDKEQASNKGELIFSNPLADIIDDMNPLALLSKHMDTTSSDYEKLKTEVAKTSTEVIQISTQSFRYISTYHELLKVSMPTLTVMGENDTFIPVPDKAILNRLSNSPQSKVIVMPGVRHFPMLEDTTKFVRLLRDFLEAPDVATLELKDEWRRRTR